MLEVCQDGLERIRRTVGSLQKLARIEDAEWTQVDVCRLIEQSIAIVWNQIRLRARLARHLGEVPLIHANAPALGQVFVNLLVNAARAIPDGNAEQNEVAVTTRLDGGEIVVEIRNTGSGIAPEVLARIFDPFFTKEPAGTGAGLGLFISHQIVVDHGGRIEVESQSRCGTVVRVFLPTTSSAPSMRDPDHEPRLE
jgi:signal transduction histidine kinase